MTTPQTISVVIPVYNEEKFINQTISDVLSANTLGLKLDIVVVDDGSTDNTPSILHKLSQNDSIKIISLPKNQGKGAAMKSGLQQSTGDIVLVQDADHEYRTSNYPDLIQPFLKDDVDAVFGSRFISAKPHRTLYFWHYAANKSITLLSNIFTNLNLTDVETGFKVFKGNLIRNIAPKLVSKKFGFEPEITARLSKIPNIKIFEVGTSYFGRTYEEGKKIRWPDGFKAIGAIIYFNLFSR